MGNPEFTRNVWLEMTPHRLIAMPLVIGAILFFVHLVFGGNHTISVSNTALTLFYLIALLWGTRQAAAAVAVEVRDATWDAQRVSALGAGPMSWGKLFGATLFQWYGGLICLAVIVVLPSDELAVTVPFSDVLQRDEWAWTARLGQALLLALATLAGQAVALAASLAVLRKAPDGRRMATNLCHGAGLLTVFALVGQDGTAGLFPTIFGGSRGEVATWYGHSVDTFGFEIFVVLIFLFWALLAVYRSMRGALQHRTLPWGWAAFAVFLMVYLDGYLYEALKADGTSVGGWFIIPAFVAVMLVYPAFLTEEKNVVTVSAYFTKNRSMHPGRIVAEAPSWLVCLVLATVLVIVVVISGGDGRSDWSGTRLGRTFGADNFFITMLALLLFVFRDIGFLLFLNLNPSRRRADTAGLFYLFLLYVVGTGIAMALRLEPVMHVFAPIPRGHPALIVGPVLLETLGVLALLRWRLRPGTPVARPATG